MSPTPGRPRDPHLDRRILDATFALLAQHGYSALRIDDVAAASGAAKTTIYRRWPSLSHLAVAAVAESLGEREVAESGDPERDLRELVRTGVASIRRAGPGLASIALDIAHQDDPQLRRAYRAAMVDPLRERAIAIVRAGQASGVFRADVAPDDVVDPLIGAAVYRLVILQHDVTAQAAEQVLDALLRGLRA